MKSSSWSRVATVLFKPAETFAEIAERPTWGVALAVFLALSTIATLVVFSRFDVLEAMRQQIASQHQAVPAGFEGRAGLIKGCSEAGAIAVPAIALLIAAAIFLVFNLAGGQLGFKTSFAVVVHASMPNAVGALLTVAVALSRPAWTAAEVQGGLLHSNLAFLAPADASKTLVALLTRVDLFSLWTLVLLTIGFRIAAKVSRTTSAAVVFGLWIVLVAVVVGFAALGASMAGARGATG